MKLDNSAHGDLFPMGVIQIFATLAGESVEEHCDKVLRR